MIDLGTKPNKEPMLAKSEAPDKPTYPTLTLNDDNVDRFKKETGGCEIGEIYSGYVELKVTGIRDDTYGKSLNFDVVSIDELESEGYSADGGNTVEGGKEKPKSKYKNPAVGAALNK